jgi:TatD DNase family protein
MKNIIDGHAHLDAITPLSPAIERALSIGVSRIIAVGMDMESNRNTLEIARKYPGYVFPAIGYHPWSIKEDDLEDTLSFIEKHITECVAVGEVGLDYKIKVKKALQWEVFSQVLRIARQNEKPVIIHTRFSYERAHRMVVEAGIEKAVFHWYSGPENILSRIISDGYFVSATPALAFSKAHREAIYKAPSEKILIETDSPVKYRYKTSEPADLFETLRQLAQLKEVSEDLTAGITIENTQKLYSFSDNNSFPLRQILDNRDSD